MITHGNSLCRDETGRSITCPEHDLGHKPVEPVTVKPFVMPTIEERKAAASNDPRAYHTREYRIPGRFWEDHLERACRCNELCPLKDDHEDDYGKATSKGITVTLTDLDAEELLSDARYYQDATKTMDPSYIGIQSSARATIKAVLKVLKP